MSTRNRNKARSHNLSSYGMNKLRLAFMLIACGIGLTIYGWTAAELTAMLFGIYLILTSGYTVVELYRLANGKNLY